MSSPAHTPSRSSFPAVVAIIGIFLLFWFLMSKVYVKQAEAPATEPVERPSLAEREGQAAALLNDYKVLDAANGKVRLPIERAKELVIAENTQ